MEESEFDKEIKEWKKYSMQQTKFTWLLLIIALTAISVLIYMSFA